MRFLQSLGLHRKDLRAWLLYDWANSVFMTTVVQVYPIYFAKVAAADLPPAVATERFALATTASMTIIALLAPVLGAMADHSGSRKRMLGAFLALGVAATAGLALVGPGDWVLGLALFVVANIGVTGSFVFYDALLPFVAEPHEVDRVSSAGYAAGYLGGGVLLAVNMVWMARPESFGLADSGAATRLAFLSAAVWWLAFAIPLFRHVPEPPVQGRTGPLVRSSFARLAATLRDLRGFRHAFLMLLAFLLYNDGINTVIRMGTIYGTELGIPSGSLLLAVLMVQLVGVPFAFVFSSLASRFGTRRAIFVALGTYVFITGLGYQMTEAWEFFVLCFLVGTVQGGSQALSRSLFATMVPRHKTSEFFAFFAVFEKFAGIFGPALFAAMIRASGSSRDAVASLVGFFVVGGVLLALVDVEAGQRAAREAEEAAA